MNILIRYSSKAAMGVYVEAYLSRILIRVYTWTSDNETAPDLHVNPKWGIFIWCN